MYREVKQMTPTMECRDINISFKGHPVLHQINVTFEPNVIHGLLGANGVGKTTLMHILAGHTYPDQGEIIVNGQNLMLNEELRSQVCLVKVDDHIWSEHKVKEIMAYGELLHTNWDANLATRLLEIFELPLKRKYSKLSRGMKSLVGIVRGLASRCPVTILDEPTLGLDADKRDLFYDLILQEYTKYPRTFIISTHLIDEAFKLFEKITYLENGTILANMDSDTFVQQAKLIQGDVRLLEQWANDSHVIHQEKLGGTLALIWLGDLPPILTTLQEQDIQISGLSPQKLIQYLIKMNDQDRGEW
jgi:ABC-2 type transport system ATP-binding protein